MFLLLASTAMIFAQIGVFGGVQGGMNATHSGAGAPADTVGVDGDLYIDTTAGAAKLYGPKTNGHWPAGIALGAAAQSCTAASSSSLGCLIVPANSGLTVDANGHLSVAAGAFLGDPGANGLLVRTAAGTTAVAHASDLPTGYPYANLSNAPTDLGQFANTQAGYLASATATAQSSLLSVSNGTLLEDRSDPAMATFNIAIHNPVSRVANVVLLGDSWTEGAGFTSVKNVWAQQLQAYLQTSFGSHGTGIVPLHTSTGAWTLTGTWNQLPNLGPSQGGNNAFSSLYQASGTSNTAAMSVKYYGDHFVIYYATYTDSGAGFGVAIDGGAATTYGNQTSTGYTPKSVSIATSTGWHTAVITAPATGNCYLYGAEWVSGTSGVSVHNMGRGGARSEAFGGSPANELAWLNQISGGVQLAIISLGVNDYGESVAPATYGANLQALITYLKTSFSPAPSILILDQGNVNQSGGSPQSAYTATEQQLALANNAMFLSVSRRWGSFANASAMGVMNADGLHPNDAGYLDIASMIERRIVESASPAVQNYGSLSEVVGNATHNIGNETSSVAVGPGSLGSGNFSSAGYNAALGQSACYNLTTGHNNTCVGQFAGGSGPTSGIYDTVLGSNAQAGSSASYVIQLGSGTNSTSNTAQYMTWNFLDSSGNMNAKLLKLALQTVATAGTVAITSGLVHLTGTATVSNITPPSITVSGAAFTGCVRIIADDGFSTATGGNIANAVTLAAHSLHQGCWDGRSWYIQ